MIFKIAPSDQTSWTQAAIRSSIHILRCQILRGALGERVGGDPSGDCWPTTSDDKNTWWQLHSNDGVCWLAAIYSLPECLVMIWPRHTKEECKK
eukprot:1158002-Pelagomonas_calceolata.AAC.1